MNDESRLSIPRRLDDKPKMLWWDLDQAIVVMTCLAVGIVAEMLMLGIGVGLLLGYLYSKAKSGKHPSFAVHLMYWFMPEYCMKFKKTPPSYQNEFTG